MASQLPPDLRPYQDALYAALADPGSAVMRDRSILDDLLELTAAAGSLTAPSSLAASTVGALREVAMHPELPTALDNAALRFESGPAFGEAIYFARGLTVAADAAMSVVELRRYVESSAVPATMPELAVDADALLRVTTFEALWQRRRFDDAAASLELWRTRYVAVYSHHHGLHSREIAAIAGVVEDTTLQAAAIERLNTLRRLGPAVAVAALEEYRELERLFACPMTADSLSQALLSSPMCPQCGFALGDRAPVADMRRVRQALSRGLLTQQRRLAQRVVARLLASPARTESERLGRFMQVVQASDLAGLALVLDDALIEFLGDFLEPRPDAANLVERLSASFPEVTLANIDGVVAELRRLLISDVVAAGGLLRLSQASQDT